MTRKWNLLKKGWKQGKRFPVFMTRPTRSPLLETIPLHFVRLCVNLASGKIHEFIVWFLKVQTSHT